MSETCDHPMTAKLSTASVACVVCLLERVEFEHRRWEECAAAYAVERERRQELEVEAMDWETRVRSEREARKTDVAKEREACARVADTFGPDPTCPDHGDSGWNKAARKIAAAVRARGEK